MGWDGNGYTITECVQMKDTNSSPCLSSDAYTTTLTPSSLLLLLLPHTDCFLNPVFLFSFSVFFSFFFFKFAQHVLPRLIFKRPANTIFSHQWKYIYMAEYSRKTRLWSASTDGVIDRRELQRGTQASASHINCSRRLKDVNLIYVQCSPSQTPFWGVALQARRSCVSRADVDFWRLEIPFLVPASLH